MCVKAMLRRKQTKKGENTMFKRLSLLFPLLLLTGFVLTSARPASADDDPPGRVARLNYMQGSVSFQANGEGEWTQANVNRPLTTGDNLWSDKDSRGEFHVGSTAFRMSSETGISILNLDDRTVQIQLAQGTLDVHIWHFEGGDAWEIDTPNLAFSMLRPGEYRVDVDADGNTTVVTVREGESQVTGGGSQFHLDTGDRTRFTGTDTLSSDEGQAGPPDEFDQWCQSRDFREEHSESAQYVSRDINGYNDLDDYGTWREFPEYGRVWVPTGVAVGWAPYRFGHWVFIAPWGWTWIEDEPWGFAPFHYGRWAVYGGVWGWVPGPVVVRPVYAPALVAFVGGPHFSLSLSIGGGGGVAWFPLGPREVYVPGYRCSPRYVQNVNITNTIVERTTVVNVYNNVNVEHIRYMHQSNEAAVTAVSHDTFVNARPVGRDFVHVKPEQLRDAEVVHSVNAEPGEHSYVGASAHASVRPPERVMQREVVAKLPPPAQRPAYQSRAVGTPDENARPGFRSFSPPGKGPQGQPQQPPPGQPNARGPQNQPIQPPHGQPQVQQPPHPQPQVHEPPVRYAPHPQANENTYNPHKFEKPPAPPKKEPEKKPGRGNQTQL